MAEVDPIIVGLVVAILVLIFFFYLMLRRTLLGFREGVEKSKRK